ncbi:hypothetical protein E2542_SST26163 [Spatholobus suberectus]|nr:hypothetical protein E2542_SST26163 [Spatholobus suberectus]
MAQCISTTVEKGNQRSSIGRRFSATLKEYRGRSTEYCSVAITICRMPYSFNLHIELGFEIA